ncbi:peptidylprolyl isomerase [Sansalvadorimonas sp. 2012CJ34-2]|uniref:Peptidyl-prolyl cis-trans isomerase n=1 Tax=Parendozoicomonas callyspongiae TaxID=2942213 RepID=A0ABT0PFE0_9GAMM|nr:peptidylprolyl isomerase [Sansalvadorimonas sp. 2012CJ34-2]MCL6269482.1 peptidylprolyl isomerase [Sansalvadorimonas sp. 2012CJ34-2]
MTVEECVPSSTLKIEAGSQVSLHFALKLANGDAVDSNFDGKPATLTVGDGNLPPGFESCLLGLQVGEHKSFEVHPENAFGQHNPSNIQQVARDSFSLDMTLEEGLLISFADPAGGELPGMIQSFDDLMVSVDFNHPLAGKTLIFEVKILSVSSSQ